MHIVDVMQTPADGRSVGVHKQQTIVHLSPNRDMHTKLNFEPVRCCVLYTCISGNFGVDCSGINGFKVILYKESVFDGCLRVTYFLLSRCLCVLNHGKC